MTEREELYRQALGLPPGADDWALHWWTAWRYLHPQTRRARCYRWWLNVRFTLGYRTGGFRSASREPR